MVATTRRRGSTVLMAIMVAVMAAWAALGVPSARANGGETIAAAPQLPLDQLTASGYVQKQPEPIGGEYWRVEMEAGALLTFDGTVTSTCGVDNHHPEAYVYVYPPSTTDFTRRETSGVTDQALNPSGELQFTAPSAGNWLVEVGIGGASCGDFAYSFTAKVQDPTHATLMIPSSVRRGRSFSLEGSIAGAVEGSVAIQLRKHHRWATLAPDVPLHSGMFRWKAHPPHRGRDVYRVLYAGDSGHLPASAQRAVIVR
jgi:hypothetical protein